MSKVCLAEIEDMQYEGSSTKSTRAEIECQKQEEVARARVRQVDDQGRSYGTGRRKCSIARVWIQPVDGKFMINNKGFDVSFLMLDHRAALLRPFSETKTSGLWDVDCTVKGGSASEWGPCFLHKRHSYHQSKKELPVGQAMIKPVSVPANGTINYASLNKANYTTEESRVVAFVFSLRVLPKNGSTNCFARDHASS